MQVWLVYQESEDSEPEEGVVVGVYATEKLATAAIHAWEDDVYGPVNERGPKDREATHQSTEAHTVQGSAA